MMDTAAQPQEQTPEGGGGLDDDVLENWNAGERGIRAERAFPLLSQHLNSGSLPRQTQQALQQYISNQDLAWMTTDLSFLSTHSIRFVECGVTKRVNAYLLGYQSGYFRGIFKYTDSTSIDIRLDWLSPIAPSILAAIDAMSLSGCDASVTDENCLHMFVAADFMMCEQLRSRCLQHIRRSCEADCTAALVTWSFAHPLLGFSELIHASARSLLKNFAEIRRVKEFLDLDGEALQEILGHRMLNCTSELQVLETIGHWLHHQPRQLELRGAKLERLLCCVRLSRLQPEQLKAAQALPAAAACGDYLEYLRTYPMPTAFSARNDLQLARSGGPRRPHQVALVLRCHPFIPSAGRRTLTTSFVYDQCTDAWDQTPPDRRPVTELVDARNWQQPARPEEAAKVSRLCLLSVGDCLFMVSGWWGGIAQELVLLFDRKKPNASWELHSKVTLCRYLHCCAAVEGFLYAVGGLSDRDVPVSSVERIALSLRESNWSAIDPMQRPRVEAAAVAHRGRLLVVGGFDGKAHLDTAEMYCPLNGVWTALSGGSMSQRRSGLGLVTCGDAVYALCGRNASGWRRSIERWEEGRSWKACCKVTAHRSNFGYAAIDNRIYLFGGVSADGHVPSTEWIDLSQQPPLCGQGRPVPLTGESFATLLLNVELEDRIGD